MHPYVMIAIGIPVTIVLIRIVINIVSLVGNKKRTKELRQLAESLNLSFDVKGDGALASSLSKLMLFSGHRSPCMRNVMHGRVNDIDMTVMDYEYSTGSPGSGRSRQHFMTIIEFRSSLLQLPSFTLTPQGWLHNIAINFGAPDINFDSHPSFSKQSLLFGADEEAIRKVFTADVLEFYEQRGQWSTAGDGDRLLFYTSSKRIPPEEISSFVEEVSELFNLFTVASEEAS